MKKMKQEAYRKLLTELGMAYRNKQRIVAILITTQLKQMNGEERRKKKNYHQYRQKYAKSEF